MGKLSQIVQPEFGKLPTESGLSDLVGGKLRFSGQLENDSKQIS